MKLHFIQANRLRVAAYVAGDGPQPLMLLHGFPDDAATMLGLMERLDHERYTLLAPYLRGYSPTSHARDGRYSLKVLGEDVLALSRAMGFDRPIVLGHDWGALSAYAAAQLEPEALKGIITMSVPPPKTFLNNVLKHPQQLRHSAYMMRLQVPWLAQRHLSKDDFALVEELWRRWSPSWSYPATRHKKVKATLRKPHTTHAAPRYYQGLLLDALLDPEEWWASFKLALKPIKIPALLISGAQDRCIIPQMYQGFERAFAQGVSAEHVLLPDCGHFPQHERLEQVATLIAQATTRFDGMPKAAR